MIWTFSPSVLWQARSTSQFFWPCVIRGFSHYAAQVKRSLPKLLSRGEGRILLKYIMIWTFIPSILWQARSMSQFFWPCVIRGFSHYAAQMKRSLPKLLSRGEGRSLLKYIMIWTFIPSLLWQARSMSQFFWLCVIRGSSHYAAQVKRSLPKLLSRGEGRSLLKYIMSVILSDYEYCIEKRF